VAGAVVPGCEAFFSPCGDLLNDRTGDITLRNGLVDGTWVLTSVDGVAFNGNRRLPDGSTLLKGELDFQTRTVVEGECKTPKETKGDVIALYQLKNAAGVIQRSKVQAGSFSFVNSTNVLTIGALGRSGSGSTTLSVYPSTFRIVAPIPLAVAGVELGTVDYNLVFTR
jgi:hypothetical protein